MFNRKQENYYLENRVGMWMCLSLLITAKDLNEEGEDLRKKMAKKISQTDIAYLAGLFDGEGCVTCKQRKTKRKDRGDKVYNQWYIRCEINMADKAAIQWIHDTLGFGWWKEKMYYKRPAHYKRQWRWACGYRDALKFAKLVWPYIQVKLNRIELIIDHYEPAPLEANNVVNLEKYRNE